jgi:hypothetical protein
MLARKTGRSPCQIALPFCLLEFLPLIAVVAARSPMGASGLCVLGLVTAGVFRRLPEPASSEPFHDGVRMPFAQPIEGRHELVAGRRSEGRG